jgi:hypothetical protein
MLFARASVGEWLLYGLGGRCMGERDMCRGPRQAYIRGRKRRNGDHGSGWGTRVLVGGCRAT